MEEDERVQKLKAGKEKLAQFQKKKKKKKRPSLQDVFPSQVHDAKVDDTMDISSADLQSVGASLVYDSDPQSQSTCSEDETSTEESNGRAYVQVKSKLQEKTMRVEELEESLVGKQLALDKVIRENQELRQQVSKVYTASSNEAAMAEIKTSQLENQSSEQLEVNQSTENKMDNQSSKTMENKAGKQEFDLSDVQELLHHVQWLQLQLKQANGTMNLQNERQKSTGAALNQAKEEILVLKDNIEQKDQVLNQLAEKLTTTSSQHNSLKASYQELLKNPVENNEKSFEKEVERTKEIIKSEYEDKLERYKAETLEETKALTRSYEDQLTSLQDEMKIKIDELEAENVKLKTNEEELSNTNKAYISEIEELKLKNESLSKSLSILNQESEYTEAKLNEVLRQHENLKAENKRTLEEKDKLQSNFNELLVDNSEINAMKKKLDTLEVEKEEAETKLNQFTQTLEDLKVENENLSIEIQSVESEAEKLKEDNSMYQNQLSEHEDKMSQHADIMEENHSFRMQNDELYNKINNQKDIIASLKGEIDLITNENSQLVNQLKDHTAEEEKFRKEIGDLIEEREQLILNADSYKAQLDLVLAENVLYKDNMESLESEISKLKQNLVASKDVMNETNNKPFVNNTLNNEDSFTDSIIAAMKPMEEEIVIPESIMPVAQELVSSKPLSQIYQENVIPSDNIVNSIEEDEIQRFSFSTNGATDINMSFNQNQASDNQPVVNRESAKTSDKTNAIVVALQQEVKQLREQLNEHRVNSFETDDMKKSVENDNVQTECVVDTVDAPHSSSEEDVCLKNRVQVLEEELQKVMCSLQHKQDLCEELEMKVRSMSAEVRTDGGYVSPLEVSESIQLKPKEVSDQPLVLPSLSPLDLEVNMHASSNQSQHGTFSTEPSESIADHFTEQNNESQINQNKICELGISSPLTEQVACYVDHDYDEESQSLISESKDTETVETIGISHNSHSGDITSDTRSILEQDCITTSSATDQTIESSGREDVNDTESEDELAGKNMKDFENQNKLTENRQQEIHMLNECLNESNDENVVLQHEIEKLQWERDELQLRLQDVESELSSTKLVICDKEFEEEKIKEDYNSVKDRLEYLESSADDALEMKEMFDRIQEEKDRVLTENENLQCSLSAAIEQNEKLLKSMETLKTDNSKLVKELTNTKADVVRVTEKMDTEQLISQGIQNRLQEIEKLLNEQETKFTSEIEGLLEENSTLKTKLMCVETVLESVQHENERLNSLFPSIDSATEENKELKLKLSDLESKISDSSAENETLVKELMEQESKLRETCEEKDSVINKCEELERIIEEMDDEKTELLNTIESHEQSKVNIVKENDSTVERLEMQLSGLDEENSTLKTLISGLKQDLEESKDEIISHEEKLANLQEENGIVKSENIKFNDNVISLQQSVSSLTEQIEFNKEMLLEKAEMVSCLENKLRKVSEDLNLFMEKCKSLEHDNFDLKNQEHYLKEQIKVYENSLSSSESTSEEAKRLGAQLELEIKYKSKLQKDLERHEEVIDELEKENSKLNDRLDQVKKSLFELNVNKQGDEKLIAELSNELEEIRMLKDEITTELNSIDAEYQSVVAKNGNLEHEVQLLQGNLKAVSENRNHIRSQTEVLVSEIEYLSTCRDSLSAYVHKVRMQNRDLLFKNHQLNRSVDELKKENETLESENEQFKAESSEVNSGQSESDANNENSSDINDIPEQFETLSKAVEDLNEQLGASEKEKEELENLTEELTNMLRDMQTKYEEVKSEMENTKKSCDKEINQLQTQLQVMNDDVLQLRKMLDMMENEMYHAAEEKTVLKENLEQQQIQYVEAVEQKQILEEILSVKSEKDKKNQEMASKRNQVDNDITGNTASACNSGNVNFASSSNLEPCDHENILETENVQLSSEAQLVSHLSSEHTNVPTFDHAFNFFDLQSPDSKMINSSVQTDMSHRSDHCIVTDSDKALVVAETQTDPVPQNFVPHTHSETSEYDTYQQHIHETEIVSKSIENKLCVTECESQTSLETFSVSCQTDIDNEQKPEFIGSEKELSHEYEKETDCSNTAEDIQENMSVASLDSGIHSVSMCADSDKHEQVQTAHETVSENLSETNSSVNQINNEEIPLSGTESTGSNKMITGTHELISCDTQTDIIMEAYVEEQMKEKITMLEEEYKEKVEQAESEIENKLLQKFEFREQSIKTLENSYDKKVKQMKYDLEEEFEFKFREREAELMVEADNDKKLHAKEVEQEADLRIEKIKKEKDQQFVETLQNVKRDLAKRQWSRKESKQRRREVVPALEEAASLDGDRPGEKGDNVRQLQKDNEDLASARDALLHKINQSQQEQSAFHENILSIMGDEETMRSSLQQPNQKMPSWLDWELVPDISFDSMTSSIDSKSLSGSLDLASFCNKSDCLSIRMKYEQLMEKIQQYLKIKSSYTAQNIDEEDETNENILNEYSSGADNARSAADRFVEHKEPDSQMLHRLTSIDLEHFVRVPSDCTGQTQDQFVLESENLETHTQPNDIIESVLKSQANDDYNKEGQFSENEDVCNERVKEIELEAGHFVPIDLSKSRAKTTEFHLNDINSTDGNDLNLFKNIRRHFSESDVTQDRVTETDTRQGNIEGHFVLESSPADSDSVAIVGQSDQREFLQLESDDVFKPEVANVSSQKPSKRKRSKQKQKKKTPESKESPKHTAINSDKFIVESYQDEASPGSERVLLPKSPLEPQTGEESGDFFEEKIVKSFRASVTSEPLSRPSFFSDSLVLEHKSEDNYVEEENRVESGDILETIAKNIESQINITETHKLSHEKRHSKSDPSLNTSKKVLTQVFHDIPHATGELQDGQETHLWNKSGARNQEAKQDLETDSSNTNPAFTTGKQSYENTVFDILNSICPGTDPSRIPGKFRPTTDQFQATADEFSGIPDDTSIDELKKINHDIQIKLNELQIERDKLTSDLSEKKAMIHSLEGKLQSESQDVRKLENVCIALEDENKSLKEKISQNIDLESKISKMKTKLSEMKNEKDSMLETINAETSKLKNDKTEIENALLAQADMYDQLVTEKKVLEEQLLPKKKELEESLMNCKSENESISKKLEKESQLRAQLESANENISIELSSLKETKNELNILVSSLKSDLQDLKQNLMARSIEIDMLEKVNTTLKQRVDECLQSSRDSDSILKQRELEVKNLFEDKETLLKQVHTFQDKMIDLDTVVGLLTEEVNCLAKENLSMRANENILIRNAQNSQTLQNERDNLRIKLNEVLDIENNLRYDIEELLKTLCCEYKEHNDMQTVVVSNNPMSDLKTEMQKLVTERKSLLCKLDKLSCEKDELAKTLEILREEEVTNLAKDNDVSLEEGSIAKESAQTLLSVDKEDDQGLREKVKMLAKENEELKVKLKDIEQKLSEIKELNKDDEWAIKELADQIENLQEENRNLEEERASQMIGKETEYEKLKSELRKLNEEIKLLKVENDKLKRQQDNDSDSENDVQILKELKEAVRSLESEKSALEKEMSLKSDKQGKESASLSYEIEKLQEENDSLRKKYRQQEEVLKKENCDILKMYNDLRTEVEVLVISKHDLEIELHALKDLLEQEADMADTSITSNQSQDTSRELTIQDIEEMNELKENIDKLKSDLKEKDKYVRKLEEHLLNINIGLPSLSASNKSSVSKGEPVISRRRKRPLWLEYGRRAYSHDQPIDITERQRALSVGEQSPLATGSIKATDTQSLESSVLSEKQFVAGINEESSFRSSVNSLNNTTLSESFEVPNNSIVGEDGHSALNRKQFELVDEITTLRRDFRETKALYAQEAALLTEALEKEKTKKEMLDSSRDRSRSGSLSAYDYVKLRKEIAVLKEENKMVKLESERWILRLKEQEQIVMDLKNRLGRNTSGFGEIEEVFGRQLALLQKQREELIDQLKERDIENCKLSTTLGERAIVEESLRREKDALLAKLEEKSEIENEMSEYKIHYEKQGLKQKQMEEIINQKDKNEIQLMKQKRMLEEELHEIESKFKDKEENLEVEKNVLLNELRETRQIYVSTYMTEDDDHARSICSDGAVSMSKDIGKLEKMLEEVEKQHNSAVKILREQLQSKHAQKEQTIREEHSKDLKELRVSMSKQVQ